MKTLLVFRGPSHHSQLLRPVELALEARGWKILRYTADVEGCFQSALNEELGADGYLWLNDYLDGKKARALYDSHASYFQDLYSTANPLSLMTPQVLDRIVLGTCEEWVATEKMVKKVQPDACLALHELNRWGLQLGYFSSRRGIPFYTLQEGLYYGEPWIYTGHTRFSKSFVWGEATRRTLLAAGCADDRLFVVGHPDLSARFEKAEKTKEEARALLPEAIRSRKLALFFFTNVDIKSDIGTAFDGMAEQEEWGCIARIHQLASAPHIEKVEKAFTRPGAWFSPNSLPLSHHWQLLALVDLFIVIGCSSSILEWAACRRGPVGQIPSNYMLRDFAKEGLAVDCAGLTFLAGIKKVEAEWGMGHEEQTTIFVREELASRDAAEKIADQIVEGVKAA